jgi:hypothetical protein
VLRAACLQQLGHLLTDEGRGVRLAVWPDTFLNSDFVTPCSLDRSAVIILCTSTGKGMQILFLSCRCVVFCLSVCCRISF